MPTTVEPVITTLFEDTTPLVEDHTILEEIATLPADDDVEETTTITQDTTTRNVSEAPFIGETPVQSGSTDTPSGVTSSTKVNVYS